MIRFLREKKKIDKIEQSSVNEERFLESRYASLDGVMVKKESTITNQNT